MQERKKNKSAKNIRIGSTGLEFSRRILNKYAFFRKSGKLPSLIFLKLFSNKIESGKLRPYPKSKSIINYFRFHFSLYFGMVRRSMNVSGTSPMEHVSFIIESIEPQSGENELKRISNSVKEISSKKYHPRSFEQDKILEFLNIRGKRADIGYNFISMPEIFQPYGSMSDSIRTSGQSGSSASIQAQYVQTINTAGKPLNSTIFPEFIYLGIFQQMMMHMHHEPGKNYGKLLLIKKKGTRKINYSYARPSKRHDSSYHITYLMAVPAKIALSPAASGYLQRVGHPENAGSMRYNVTSSDAFRKIGKDLGISGSLSSPSKIYSAMESSDAVKTDNLPMNQDVIARNVRYGHDNSYYFSYLMTAPAKVSLSPAASGYLQRNRYPENAGSIRYNATSPAVYRKIGKDLGVTGSLRKNSKLYLAVESSAARTGNLSMNQDVIALNVRYGHDRDDYYYYFSYLMAAPAKIALSPAASGYLQRVGHPENAGSIQNNPAIPVVMRKMNNEITFSGSLSVEPVRGYSAIDNSAAVKTYNLTMNQKRIIQDRRHEHTRDSDWDDGSDLFSYLTTGHAKVGLSPAASGYLQRYRHPENTGSIRQNPAIPVVIRKMNKEITFSGSLSVEPVRGNSAIDNSASVKTYNLTMNQNRIIQDKRPELNRDSGRDDGSDLFSYLMTAPAKIALSPAASGYLQRNWYPENTGSIRQNPAYNPSELVIKRTSLKEAENLIRNTQEKTASTRITDHPVKDSIRERPINEINRIADRVYHIIERKISIEKDRRGLL